MLFRSQEIIDSEGVSCVQVSCFSEEGVMELKNKACDALLAHRVEVKMKGSKINSIANRIHVSQPKPRDEVVRAPFIPEGVKNRKKYDKNDPERRRLLRDEEDEQGGAGVYNISMQKDYLLANPDWKFDVIPEIMEGKNIADFIDPDIEEKLEALEREEERLQAEGFYDEEEEMFDSDDEREALEAKEALGHKIIAQSTKKNSKNAARLPRTAGLRTITELTDELTKAGYDPSRIQERAAVLAKIQGAQRKRQREEDEEMEMDDEEGSDAWSDDDAMDVDAGSRKVVKKQKTVSGGVVSKREPRSDRSMAGFKNEQQYNKALKLRNLGQRPRNMLAKAGEGDRDILTKMPKHLFAGKRKGGKTQRR